MLAWLRFRLYAVRGVGPWTVGAVVVGALWLTGLVLFLAADGRIEIVLPRSRAPKATLQNLAAWDLGPTVRASSYYRDWLSHHHPLFLVDGRATPDSVEKWASSPSDEKPWIEIIWREEHELERVVLRHAGSVEPPAYTVRHYVVTCLEQSGRGPALDVIDNALPIAEHDLRCPRARGVHIDFQPNQPGDPVRVFEVEAWGR